MSQTFVMLLLLWSSSTFASGHQDDGHAEAAVSFTEKAFQDLLDKNAHFVMFFAPWCGHCKRLAPTWHELAQEYNLNADSDKDKVVIAKVDCTEETYLCSEQDVTGYPTLKFYTSGSESGVKYRGPRDIQSLKDFVEEKMGRSEAKNDIESSLDSEEPVVDNGLHILSLESFKKITQSKGDLFVKFYAPWCGHCKKLAPTWDQLAKAFENDQRVKIAKLDCTQAQAVCQENEVKGYPTLHYLRDGKVIDTYKGSRTFAELKDFVESMTKEDNPESDNTHEGLQESDVIQIDAANFENAIEKGLSFVKFFAPWCGHCKRLAPIWESLGSHYATSDANVKIFKVDCTSDDNKNQHLCEKEGVKGFPTLNIYRDGDKLAEYSGKRSLEDMKVFIDNHLKSKEAAKDEL